MKESLPQRKSIRLRDHDYGEPGFYFVTICTAARRENILCAIKPAGAASLGGPRSQAAVSSRIILTDAGIIVEKYINRINRVYSGLIHVDRYVIMPDHVHLIVQICALNGGPPRAAAPAAALPNVINAMKGLAVKEIGYRIWQRGYYEHIIRSEADLRETRRYIQNNPLKWIQDRID